MMNGSPQEIATRFCEELGCIDKALDVGCGKGEVGYTLIKRKISKHVYGVDVDEEALKVARKRGISTCRVDLSSEKLPFSDEFFDVVLCLDVIEHVVDVDNVMSEIRRVLKPNGILIISTPNVQFIYHIIKLILGYGPRTSFGDVKYHGSELYDCGHVHYFTAKDLCNLLGRWSFRVVSIRGSYNVRNKILRSIMKLSSKNSLLLKYLCPGIVIKAEKRCEGHD